MSRLERLLLLGIVFLLAVKFMMPMADPDKPYAGLPGTASDPTSEADPVYGSPPAGTQGSYDWDPDGFSMKSIPPKLTIERGGRVRDSHNLDDTQKAFVYATMMAVYDKTLDRARADCAPGLHAPIDEWKQKHANIVSDAERVRDALNIKKLPRTTRAYLALPQAQFRRKVCPEVTRNLAGNRYDAHPEAIDRLAQAAGSR